MAQPRQDPKCLMLPLTAASIGILCLYYTTVFVVIDEWIGLRSAAGFANAIFFSGFTVMTVISYIMAMFSEPGDVPSFYNHDLEDPKTPLRRVKKKRGDLRFCRKCRRYKPPRAHHCHICGKCILRKDHHCFWIGNCVGQKNFKIFFLLLMYSLMACVHSSTLLGCAAYDVYKAQEETGEVFKNAHVACGALLCPLTLALLAFFMWHVYLIINNMTTIEYFKGVRSVRASRNAESISAHRHYNLGAYENFVSLFGRNAACWMCPIYKDTGHGLYFMTVFNDTNMATSSNM